MSSRDIQHVMFQAADAAIEHGLDTDTKIYLVQDLLELKIGSEDECLTANKVFNFLFDAVKKEILYYALCDNLELVEFSLINDLMIATIKRKYAHVL